MPEIKILTGAELRVLVFLDLEVHHELRRGDRTKLTPHMTFHDMTNLLQDYWGLEITERFVITEAGAECLASLPRSLLVKD